MIRALDKKLETYIITLTTVTHDVILNIELHWDQLWVYLKSSKGSPSSLLLVLEFVKNSNFDLVNIYFAGLNLFVICR